MNAASLRLSPLPTEAHIRKAFPDLAWLKERVNTAGMAWPSLIMNATATASWRPDIRGPLCLFMNLRGTSHVSVDGYRVPVGEDVFFLSNADQHYSFEIDSPQPVETFNLHLGSELVGQTLQSLVLPPELLCEGGRPLDFAFPNRLWPRDAALEAWLRRARGLVAAGPEPQAIEALLQDLLVQLLSAQAGVRREIGALPALKAGTRRELHARLNRARDLLYASEGSLSLDELAAAACLSKFHFLRLFRAAYGCTPHQFQLGLRMQRACRLLERSRLSVQEIAWALGSEDVAVFSRQFRARIGVYPGQYRQAVGKA